MPQAVACSTGAQAAALRRECSLAELKEENQRLLLSVGSTHSAKANFRVVTARSSELPFSKGHLPHGPAR
jgi:hypothetical protein